MKLEIELVPNTSWYNNVRTNVTPQFWNKIRTKSYRLANDKCEICSEIGTTQGKNHKLECHEIWHYNFDTKIQKLVGFISLCPDCHRCKHPGLANIKNETALVISKLMRVNHLSYDEAKDQIRWAFKEWNKKNQINWEVDITYIIEYMKDNKDERNDTI
jgi:hypothetical protein